MSNARRRVLRMVADGQVTAREGDKLLAALPEERSVGWAWLLNPFEHLRTSTALAAAGVGAVVALMLGQVGVRFDGVLDMHLVAAPVPWLQALVDLAVSWPLLAMFMWIAARAVGAGGRLVDFVATVGVCRLPLVASAGLTRLAVSDPAALNQQVLEGRLAPALLVIVPLTLVALGWLVFWLFVGFRTVSNASGARCALSFTGALVLGEAASKALLWTLFAT